MKKEDITLEQYQTRQQDIFDNKVRHGFNTKNPYQEIRYITEELGELMRAFEKGDQDNIAEELADIVIFSYGLAQMSNAGDLDTKIFEKMAINASRKYIKTEEGDFVKVTE